MHLNYLYYRIKYVNISLTNRRFKRFVTLFQMQFKIGRGALENKNRYKKTSNRHDKGFAL